jgi:hypothetical protein
MDKSQRDEFMVLSLKIAEDLALKLLERRSINISKVPNFISFIGKKCQDFLKNDPASGIPYLRLASSITGRLIERGSLSDQDAICISIAENMVCLKEIASELPEKHAKIILSSSVTLVLKMLETKTLNTATIKVALKNIAQSASSLFGTS